MTARRPPQEVSIGLARERTELAWSRTAIAFVALGGALLKKNIVGGVIVLALSALIWGLHRLFPDPGAGPAADVARPRQLLLVTLTVTAVSVVALAIALSGQ